MIRHWAAQGAPLVLVPVIIPGLTTVRAGADIAHIVALANVCFSLVRETKHILSVLAAPTVPVNTITTGHEVDKRLGNGCITQVERAIGCRHLRFFQRFNFSQFLV